METDIVSHCSFPCRQYIRTTQVELSSIVTPHSQENTTLTQYALYLHIHRRLIANLHNYVHIFTRNWILFCKTILNCRRLQKCDIQMVTEVICSCMSSYLFSYVKSSTFCFHTFSSALVFQCLDFLLLLYPSTQPATD